MHDSQANLKAQVGTRMETPQPHGLGLGRLLRLVKLQHLTFTSTCRPHCAAIAGPVTCCSTTLGCLYSGPWG
jgi:hypothetical protein